MDVRPHVVCLALACVVACNDADGFGESPDTDSPRLPWTLTEFPPLPDSMNGVPAERIELGRLLFYDPIVSVDRETACATCHTEKWGLSDGLERSIGHGGGLSVGPQRSGENVARRNSPTLFNLAFRTTFLWDGRAASLEEQALEPFLAPDELNRDPEDVVVDLAEIEEYVELFAAAFPDDPQVNVDNLASALAALQRTFISDRGPYIAYANGDLGALDEDAIDGMFRFAEQGCVDCHAPPLFEAEIWANRDVPEVEGIVDDGRAEVTGRDDDRGKFRTPTLRNIAFTSPYFHNGSVWSLEDVVRHELAQSGSSYTEEDVSLITRFIHVGLRDETRRPIRPQTVPSGLPVTIDSGT